MWKRTMAHGRVLISQTLPRLDQITPRPQDEELAAAHDMRNNHLLGERSDWMRNLSVNGA